LTVIFILAGLNICVAQFLTQNIYFLTTVGLPITHTLEVGIGGMALALVFVVASWTTIEKLGRRVLFLLGPSVHAILLFIVGGLYYAPGTGPMWAVAVILNFLIAWGTVSFISTGWAIGAELSSYRLRGKTQSLAVMYNAFFAWLFSFVTPYIYNVDSGNLGARTGFVYAGLASVYFLAAFYFVPESSVLTIAQLDWMFENQVPAREFQSRKAEALTATALYQTSDATGKQEHV
jgi:hypothetical protein